MRVRYLFLLPGILICLFFFGFIAQAAQQKDFSISPLRTEYEIAPGTSRSGELIIGNPSSVDITVKLSAELFSVINPQYDYAFDSSSDLSKWVSFSDLELTLSPGESRTVQYTVGVPNSVESGGRYISIFASTDTGSDEGVKSRQRIASLLYITVLGDVSRQGNLLNIDLPSIVFDKSIAGMTIQNTGTTHFRSEYNFSVYSIFGQQAANMSGDRSLILPNTVRALEQDINMPDWPGIYKLQYEIGLGDSKAVKGERWFVYLPANFLFIVAGLILVVAVYVVYKKYIKPKKSVEQQYK